MKRLFIFIFFLLSHNYLHAQAQEGVVTYERTQYYTKIIARLTFLSQEEKDRAKMTWGNDDGWKQKMVLYFNGKESKYEALKEDSEDGWSGRPEDFFIYRNFETEKKIEFETVSGKTYFLEDSLITPKWQVMNKIKEIQGYMCMMAVSKDPVKNQTITAWFANDLVMQSGPEKFFGLPGLILELDINDGDVIITASKVDLKPVKPELLAIPKKIKGKKVNQVQYDAMLTDLITTSIKGRRNPFWSIRY
ncbi:GLPGLI family protein [Dyadobacter psychrotolerans]|uniref:GLPGLI family protein n=1 Tax=Dyadobacter psychrotolerans TaxID=2541721 RepID=A0A4R5DZM8_9BACT|nr:GLPGLI family protein [Dyadobacter psychrotolerans]TDE18164.1 GLPGLI family protein [Dyadobacter psychrotolerans]